MKVRIKKKYKDFLQTRDGIDLYNRFKDILYSKNDTLVEQLFLRTITKFHAKDEISILDVGGGDGKRIIALALKIHSYFGCRVKLDFVEQSGLMCEDFRRNLSVIAPFCEVNIFHTEFERFAVNAHYDLVLLIHSIFCFNGFNEIDKLIKKTSDDGVMIVVSNDSKSFLADLKQELDKSYEGNRYEINSLTSDLERNHIDFEQTTFDTAWKVYANNLNPAFSVILEWLSLGLWNEMTEQQKGALLDMVVQRSSGTASEYLFIEKETTLVIRKPLAESTERKIQKRQVQLAG